MKRKGKIFGTLPVALAALCLAASGAVRAEDALPQIPLIKAPLKMDGVLDESAWQTAPVFKIENFCDKARQDAGEKPKETAIVKVVRDADNLYFGFWCDEPSPNGPAVCTDEKLKNTGRNIQVFGGDYVQVNLDLGRFGYYGYYVFAMSPAGDIYACSTWQHELSVNEAFEMPSREGAAKIQKGKSWTAELRVSLKEMLRYPKEGVPQIVGLNFARVRWGEDKARAKVVSLWPLSINEGAMKDHYAHMTSWKTLYPMVSNAPLFHSISAQISIPEGFGHARLEEGAITNTLLTGKGLSLHELLFFRVSGWVSFKELESVRAKAAACYYDAPRMERLEDLRPAHTATNEPVAVLTPPVRSAGVTFVSKPAVRPLEQGAQISFEVSKPTDVTVAILNAQGKIVRHLACGVLGRNPPKPFKADALAQTVLWDGKDDAGRPVAAAAAAVSLGMAVNYDSVIDIKPELIDEPVWPKRLDVEDLPNSKPLSPLGGDHDGGRWNLMYLDRARGELYVQARQVYDEKSGKFLRDFGLKKRMPSTSLTGNGEVSFGQDGFLYIGGWNELWRFDRDGNPQHFSRLGRPFVTELWRGHGNPHRGQAVGPDGDIYLIHHYTPHGNLYCQVSRIGTDGTIKKFGFIELPTSCSGLKVDREGYVYVGCTIKPNDMLVPDELKQKASPEIQNAYKRLYGSVIKFLPEGGMARYDETGKFRIGYVAKGGDAPCRVSGAVWVRPGYAPIVSRVSSAMGGPSCACQNGRFDLDEFGRLFIPDAILGKVDVVDANANTILSFGKRGASGKELDFRWGSNVVASDTACFVEDLLRKQVVKSRLDYAVVEKMALPPGK